MPVGDYTTKEEVKEYLEQLTGVATWDTIIDKIITRESRRIDTYCGRRFYIPAADETEVRDGIGSKQLHPHLDIASLTTLEVAATATEARAGTYTTIASTDYVLMPRERRPGFPALYVQFHDSPAGTYTRFPTGTATVRLIGRFGFTTTPDDIKHAAVMLVARSWRGRANGFSDVIGVTEFGTAQVSRSMPNDVREILDSPAYSKRKQLVFV